MNTASPASPDSGIWLERADEAARDQARAAGSGIAVKANIAVRGYVRSAGSPALDTRPAEADAPIVAAVRAAGFEVVGTTNMHELAFGITSNNATFGPVRLPGHPDRSAGGSSGGSAAAVATGAVSVALGTDTGGSVSIPAGLCGVVGFRPTTGRWPTAGVVGLSWTRDTTGVFATTVDAATSIDRIVTATASRHEEASRASDRPRIGLPSTMLGELHTDTQAAVTRALEAMSALADLVPVDDAAWVAAARAAEMPIVLWEAKRLLAEAASQALDLAPDEAYATLVARVAGADVRALLETQLTAPVTPDAYEDAQRDVTIARQRFQELVDSTGVEAFVFPATPAPAPLIGRDTVEHLGAIVSTFALYTRNTGPATIVGAPMLTLPVAVDDGALPIGLTLQGVRHEDAALLELGQRLERLLRA